MDWIKCLMCMCFMQNQNISRRRKTRIVSERHGPERRISEKKTFMSWLQHSFFARYSFEFSTTAWILIKRWILLLVNLMMGINVLQCHDTTTSASILPIRKKGKLVFIRQFSYYLEFSSCTKPKCKAWHRRKKVWMSLIWNFPNFIKIYYYTYSYNFRIRTVYSFIYKTWGHCKGRILTTKNDCGRTVKWE